MRPLSTPVLRSVRDETARQPAQALECQRSSQTIADQPFSSASIQRAHRHASLERKPGEVRCRGAGLALRARQLVAEQLQLRLPTVIDPLESSSTKRYLLARVESGLLTLRLRPVADESTMLEHPHDTTAHLPHQLSELLFRRRGDEVKGRCARACIEAVDPVYRGQMAGAAKHRRRIRPEVEGTGRTQLVRSVVSERLDQRPARVRHGCPKRGTRLRLYGLNPTTASS